MEVSEKSEESVESVIQAVAGILKSELGIRLEDSGTFNKRFMSHLKLLVSRALEGKAVLSDDFKFSEMIMRKYQKEYAVAGEIVKRIEEDCSCSITREERCYLAVHIRRMEPRAEEADSVFEDDSVVTYCDEEN